MSSIILYTRRDCHLCEDAYALLLRAARGHDLRIDRVDIDIDPSLRERYDARVPVVAVGGQELAWPFSERELRRLVAGT